MIGVTEGKSALESVNKNTGNKYYHKFFQAATDLRCKIERLYEKTDKCGLKHLAKVDMRNNSRGKLRPIYLSAVEYIWFSEK
eukprot:snap_masked-scaffold_23-processed-gene-1.12-mRNA-1 protein AED:1.00 eAED:1.00 QI:0/-1/0/0/-1/1/1/0/81